MTSRSSKSRSNADLSVLHVVGGRKHVLDAGDVGTSTQLMTYSEATHAPCRKPCCRAKVGFRCSRVAGPVSHMHSRVQLVMSDEVVRSLNLLLAIIDDGLWVEYRLDGANFAMDAVVAKLPVHVAGVPAIYLDDEDLEMEDDDGLIGFRSELCSSHDAEGPAICWHARRATRGAIRIAYRAKAREVDVATSDGHPPVDLRFEAGGVTGPGHAFLALPPLEGKFDVYLRWVIPHGAGKTGVCSFGAGNLDLGAMSFEALLDCHYMVGDVTSVGPSQAPVSVHYLTRPSFDTHAFAEHTAKMNQALATTFHAIPTPFRVFLRHNPYRGLSGSALTHSFVAGWNEHTLDSVERLEAFIDHELVHEWVGLDGPYDETVWYNEGIADYYGIVLPFRAGLISEGLFLSRVNLQARLGYASVYRNVPLSDFAPLYWRDFRAQQEPYYRGFFYFARLDVALRDHGRHHYTLDDLVRRVREQRRSGERVQVDTWQVMVADELGHEGTRLLDDLLRGSMEPPPALVWGETFECHLEEAPVIDPGFDVSTFITGTVTGLMPGGPAACAGLRDGDILITVPTYNGFVSQPAGQAAEVGLRRGTQELTIQFQPGFDTAFVPAWQRARDLSED